MSKELLENDILKLKQDRFHALTIYANGKTPIYKEMTAEKMASDFGSIEGFFEHLYSRGFREITIYPRRKNGSSFKKNGDEYTITFGEPIATQSKLEFEDMPVPASGPVNNYKNTISMPVQAQPVYQAEPLQGLHGANSIFKTMHYDDIKRENFELKTENKELTKANQKLEQENFKLNLEIDNKGRSRESTKELIGLAAPAFAPLLEKLMAGGQVPALGQPAPQLSPLQSQVLQFDDATLQEFVNIGVLSNKSEDFWLELDELIKKYLK